MQVNSFQKIAKRFVLSNILHIIIIYNIEEMQGNYSKQSKLVSRLNLQKQALARRNNNFKQTIFAQYSKSLYLDHHRSFRKSKVQIFKKHNNLIETNKHNIMKLRSEKSKSQFKTNVDSFSQSNSPPAFSPKTEEEIKQKYHKFAIQQENKRLNSESLQILLRKNKIKNNKNLLGLNILQLQKAYKLSRFQLHTLYSTYNTLLLASKQSIQQFKDNFQVMLNIQKITVRPEVVEQIFKEQKEITFEKFIAMYGKIDDVIYKQNIVDYIQIIFEGIYHKDSIRFQDIVRIFKNRITDSEAIDIAKTIYEQYDRRYEMTIKLTQITDLCHSCENFEKKMYRIYTSQIKCG